MQQRDGVEVALLKHAWSSSATSDGDVTAPSEMEQSAATAGGPSQLVHSGVSFRSGEVPEFVSKQ